jgi:UDP-N-acetylmuramoyl-tripeptide--D-alanyl-D-alanine ligase
MMRLLQAARLLDAALVGEDVPFSAVSTDSRSIHAGDLFVALRGERHDGHAYLPQVAASGAVAAMVDARHVAAAPSGSAPLAKLVVPDTREGLGELARHWRRRFDLPLILVVGSNGKTTVKEMIAAILRAHYGEDAVLATQGNFNNDIGLPLTLLKLQPKHRAAVVELGMNHRGETARLARLAQAGIVLINNAQREHQEFMQSVAEVAEEHADALTGASQVVLNGEDAHLALWQRKASGALQHCFGATAEQPFHARRLNMDAATGGIAIAAADAAQQIELVTPSGSVRCSLAIDGEHNLRNAAAAAAAAMAAGVSLQAVAQGLSAFRPANGRLQRHAGRFGSSVIDDSYNANPDSVRAAIEVLAALPAPRLLLLGDMGEVGQQGAAFHAEAAAYARQCGIDYLITAGTLSAGSAVAFGASAEHAADAEAAGAMALRRLGLLAGSGQSASVLVKGSRFMRMERAVTQLLQGGTHAA